MSLEELEQEYDYTNIPDDELESKVHEELEDMLDEKSRDEVEEEIKDLSDNDFREFVRDVLYEM